MIDAGEKLNVALLAVPESTASTIFGMYDLFLAAGCEWDRLTTGKPGTCPLSVKVVSAHRRELQVSNGVRLRPDAVLEDAPDPHIVCVPGIMVSATGGIGGSYGREVEWIASAYRAGAVVASAGSGTLLLAKAGILDGEEATTHWAYEAVLRQHYPGVTVHPARGLVTAGEGRRIVTAAGGASWQQLVLTLVARFVGAEEAMRLAKIFLVDWHRSGQLPFASLVPAPQYDDRIIASCEEWISEHYASPSPVAAMMRLSGLSERTFKRRFTKATGMPPIDYVHTLRLEEAKRRLESSEMSVEAVANGVGYEDTTFFRRLFRRRVGVTPREYRARVGAIRTALEEAARP